MAKEPATPGQNIVLAEYIDTKKFSATIATREAPQELRARLEREAADQALRRRKDVILFVAVTLGVIAVFLLCVGIVIRSSSSPDDKKWATSILTSIVSGAVGYLFGKSSKT